MTVPSRTPSTDTPAERPRPRLVQARGLLRGAGPRLRRHQRRRHRRPARPDRQAGLPAVARRRLPLAAAVLRVAAARRRLRHLRLHRRCCRSSAPSSDFVEFLDAAHERGMRVIIDFVMNHTSRPAPVVPGSPAATRTARTATSTSGPTTTRGYPDARIIFVDTEPSNWTFDPVRKQYFWHRFFSHQPDLNFENPAVQEAMHRRAAVLAGPRHRRLPAGRRALPVRGGGHQLREPAARPTSSSSGSARRSTREYPDRVLLAEANQWPADVVEYFGDPESAATSATWPSTSR